MSIIIIVALSLCCLYLFAKNIILRAELNIERTKNLPKHIEFNYPETLTHWDND